ncbi:MAG TPA: tyrosine/phenylalanine carboxypeptidase domain-containing protein [Polyangiaceae bacterium]|nr:tyrosine/phenylalanine carboxypeptidase domain-containing protein [Polyangiaceae bacterium]
MRPSSPWAVSAGAPHAYTPVERLLARAAHEIRVLSALTPLDAQAERARLIEAVRAGERPEPRWRYAVRPHDELRRALDTVESILERGAHSPAESLFLERARELAVEAALCASAGRPEIVRLARARFEPHVARIARAASELCAAWLAEDAPSADVGPRRPSDDPDPRSLLSLMRAAVGRLRLPFTVVESPWLAPLAATGERVILIATDRLVIDEDARRTVLHEIEGHARPRALSVQAPSPFFRVGTARGIDDQEGRAVLLEERAGLLGPRRRRQLAARHRAVEAMLDGAAFADVVETMLDGCGLDATEAVIVAERAFRGSTGAHPGLGRERVYLESLVRVREHLAARPQDDELMAQGQVGVASLDRLRAHLAGG